MCGEHYKLNSVVKQTVKFTKKIKSIIKYNHSTKFKFKTNQTLTMETILVITKKEKKRDVIW